MNPSKLQEELQTRWVGQNIVFSHMTASTSDLAKELAAAGAAEGTVVVAETQTCGHGRLGREWISPVGGLWFSTILRPRVEPSDGGKLVFVAGLAVAKSLRELYNLSVTTKWPNDVLANGKKVCGILATMKTTRRRINYVVLSVGINANFEVRTLPKALWSNATTLQTELEGKISLECLFKMVLEKLESCYDLFMSGGFGLILEEWKNLASFLGRQVDVIGLDEKCAGQASDVDSNGHLILTLSDGSKRRILAGDISVRPM